MWQEPVYPRVGGGNACRHTILHTAGGLSPRGRGKRGWSGWAFSQPRSIPAWAGETIPFGIAVKAYEVYPRVGGGNSCSAIIAPSVSGLSPRGRGKPLLNAAGVTSIRSIPAWAGETLLSAKPPTPRRVYPRVGGGNPTADPSTIQNSGLSPRGRGKRRCDMRRGSDHRSIPAWAGETSRRQALGGALRVYPRVGGGNSVSRKFFLKFGGLSPRGRGKLEGLARMVSYCRSIPAWAGETTSDGSACSKPKVYPRVGGGNTSRFTMPQTPPGLSPRGRGKRIAWRVGFISMRSIPAWAGETAKADTGLSSHRVYPRVGGGNIGRAHLIALRQGLSPRGRGKLPNRRAPCRRNRSIPAWAGET